MESETKKAPRQRKPKLLGMPAARPFVTDSGEQLFVVAYYELKNVVGVTSLAELGIPSGEYATFENTDVVGFNERELRLFLKKAEMFVATRRGSTVAMVDWVTLEETQFLPADLTSLAPAHLVPYQFELESEDHELISMNYIVSRVLGPVLKRKIILLGPQGERHPYQERGAFQVVIDATCDFCDDMTARVPAQIWGHSAAYDRSAFRGSQDVRGVLIKDGDFAVAELLPNAMYILFNISAEKESERTIMVRLCNEVATLLSSKTRYAAALKDARSAWEIQQRILFREIVEKSIPARQGNLEYELEDAKSDALEARREYIRTSRKEFVLEQLVRDPAQIGKRFEEEIERLQNGKHPLIEFVSVGGTNKNPRLHVHTKPIIAIDSETGLSHLLGRYDLMFDLTQELTLRFLNKDWHPEAYHGPHLDEEGFPCLGTIELDLTEYIAHFEMEAAASLVIAFLQNPNIHDGQGLVVREFPVVPEGSES